MRKMVIVALFAILGAVMTQAKLQTQAVIFKDGMIPLEGFLAYDDAVLAPRPGILVVHDWMGVSEETKRRCTMLADLGYVAFAADIYGKRVRPTTAEEAGKLAGKYKGDRALYRKRLNLALDVLQKDSRVDPKKLAAIGYCFGGTGVLELARSGADLRGVVSFHGGLDSLHPEDAKAIKARILVLHGADDPFVPAADVAAFQEELRKAGVDWQMTYYSGAVHAFTNPGAGSDNSKGAAYNEKADRRSWEAMKAFFAEIFK
jgi:dienelactone hydrolase